MNNHEFKLWLKSRGKDDKQAGDIVYRCHRVERLLDSPLCDLIRNTTSIKNIRHRLVDEQLGASNILSTMAAVDKYCEYYEFKMDDPCPFVSRGSRKVSWDELALTFGVKRLPQLHRPNWCRVLLVILFLGSLFGSFTFSSGRFQNLSPASRVFVSMAVSLGGCGFGFWATRSMRNVFPFYRVEELVTFLATYHSAIIKKPDKIWTRDEVGAVVRALITLEIGVRDFSDDAQFVRDLGID